MSLAIWSNVNRIPFVLPAVLGLSLVSGAELCAQTALALNGQTSLIRPLGATVTVAATGTAGLPTLLLVDATPGPTQVLGVTLPLGLTPGLFVGFMGILPASGSLDLAFTIPHRESLHAAKLYFAAVALDPAAPAGLDVSNGASLSIVARPQLAGRPLATYPFFEHVSAINRQSPVSLGVDPRFTFVAGKTTDVYVVAARTAAQWDAGPALVDVRGTAQTVTFPAAATGIQQQTFQLDAGTLPGPSEALASGDTRIGVGYDVVIDVDRDGVFDPDSDLIDGYGDDEAGFYVCRDLVRGGTLTQTNRGPHPVSVLTYSGGSFLGQRTFYPTNIAQLGQLPLVVVSHGNGHDYTWYGHIGYHLASYGYVVMSHQNNTMPGSHTAAQTTLLNTQYIIANQATIGAGVLNGRIDVGTIVWIGHSRGADGVARAYDQLFNGTFTPTNFTITDIKLVSSMAPVDFGGWSGQSPTLGGNGNGSHPHDANFHLLVAQADDDVHGCASAPQVYWYGIHERATRKRQSMSLYGVGHGDLHDGGGSSVAIGPSLIGRTATHDLMRGYYLALVSHHIRGDVPSRDYLWRQFESFRPVGAPNTTGVVVNMTFTDDPQDKFVIDNFQNQSFASPNLASSGAAVAIDVQNFVEGRCDDANGDFADNVNDPFNGFTYDDTASNGTQRSESYACVFSFSGATSSSLTYDLANLSARPNFRDYSHLSFRAAQGSRHPFTTAVLGDLTFAVTLEDDLGNQSTVSIGAYGGGIEEPYQRNTGPTCGAGVGWNSEYETIRIRLTDFLNDGRTLDLARTRKVIFRFGSAHGSAQGRLAFDDIELTRK
jgi:hypothetical protein